MTRTVTQRGVREGVETQFLIGTEPKNRSNVRIRSRDVGVVARSKGGARGTGVCLRILGLWRDWGREIDTRLSGDNVVLAHVPVKGGLI